MAKENGRKTRDAALDGLLATGKARVDLLDFLAELPTDPMECVGPVAIAVKRLSEIEREFSEILKNCDDELSRGSYKK